MIKPLNVATTEKGRLKMLLIDAEALIDEIKKAEQCYRESRMLGSHLYPYKLAFVAGVCYEIGSFWTWQALRWLWGA